MDDVTDTAAPAEPKLTSANRIGLIATGIAAVLLAVIFFIPLVVSPAIASAWGWLMHLAESAMSGTSTMVRLSPALAGGLVMSFLFARHATVTIDEHPDLSNATLKGSAFFFFIELPAVALQIAIFGNSPDLDAITTSLEALGAAPHWMAQVGAVGLLIFALAPVVLTCFLYCGRFIATLDNER